MTDAEIMKGLACCGKPNSCVDCNFGKLKGEDCIMVLANNAIELINRQKSEIAEYQKHIDQDIIYQKAVEVEAIKGFAEKLKENVTYFEDECGNFVPFVDCRDIDKILKTTGEKA